MIYISIPSNMIFQQLDISDEIIDCFVDKDDDTRIIKLQHILKELLRVNKRYCKVIEQGTFTVFLKNPPYDEMIYLAYVPNQNAKLPTSTDPYLVSGIQANKFRPQNQTRYGQFWSSYIPLSYEREQEIIERRKEQKENRLKIGDNPNTN